MSNKKRVLAKPKKQRRKATKNLPHKSLLGRAIGVGSVFLSVIGGIAALLSLLPRVTASVSDPVDQNDPFASSLTVTNTGYIPLDGVQVGIAPINIANGSMAVEGDTPNPVPLYFEPWGTHRLGLDDKFVVNLGDAIKLNGRFVSADLEINISYEIPFIHWRRVKRIPIRSRRQQNGQLTWDYREPPN